MINAYIIDHYDPSISHGLDTYITELTRSILKTNNRIHLSYIWIHETKNTGFRKDVKSRISHYHISGNITNPTFETKAIEWLALYLKSEKNLIFHFNWLSHCPFAYSLKDRFKCKIVLTKHCVPWRDLITDDFQIFSRLNRFFLKRETGLSVSPIPIIREQFSYFAMDHIICVTQLARRSLEKMASYPASKVSVIYNGLHFPNDDKEKCSNKTLRERYGFSLDEKIILFVGTISKRKGAYDLAEAFDGLATQYPDRKIRLVFAGIGNHNELLNKVKKSWSKITITGRLNKDQLYDFYAMANIGVVPSYVEQCSYTAIEMMSTGLPIIVADVDGLKEIVPEKCGIRVKLKQGNDSVSIDKKDLNDKIIYFLENEIIAKEYGLRAKSHALKFFSAERMAKQTIEVYEKLLLKSAISIKYSDNMPNIDKKPLISIVLPCYNSQDYIENCINSITEQDWNNYELIIIDDGSSDNTNNIIKKYSNIKLRYVKNNTNKGIVHSLNKGISMAKGEYIARIDSDDLMHKNRLSKQVNYLEEYPEIALVGSWQFIIDKLGKVIGLKQYPVQHEEIKLLLPFENPFSHPSIMIRSNIIKTIGYNEKYTNCEDYNLWEKIVSKNITANIPECLTYYRSHPLNNCKEYIRLQKQSALELQSTMMNKYGLNPTIEELVLHGAISSDIPKAYFSYMDKKRAIALWIEKVMLHLQKQYGYSISMINKVKDYLLCDRLEISPDILIK